MKKKWLVIVLVLSTFMLTGFLSLNGFADSSDDYKVIKKAVKKGKHVQEASWFKVQIIDNKTKKVKVKLNLPLSVVDLVAECVDLKELKLEEKTPIPFGMEDIKKILSELRKHGPFSLVEVNEDDETIKIWIE